MAALEAGKSVALITDAGTPLISDPGYRLSQSAIEACVPVIPIPGASAPMAALVASGLPSDAFLFAGFLPSRDKARRDRLASLAATEATLMFFESPSDSLVSSDPRGCARADGRRARRRLRETDQRTYEEGALRPRLGVSRRQLRPYDKCALGRDVLVGDPLDADPSDVS